MADEQHDGTDLVKDLRDTIKRISSERDELAAYKRDTVVSGTFQQFGLDPSEGPGKFVAQAYDGDLSPDSVASWLTDQGFTPAEQAAAQAKPEGMEQRVEQRQKLDRIQNDSSPADSRQKMTVAQNRELFRTDPQAALKAKQDGLVLPPGVSA